MPHRGQHSRPCVRYLSPSEEATHSGSDLFADPSWWDGVVVLGKNVSKWLPFGPFWGFDALTIVWVRTGSLGITFPKHTPLPYLLNHRPGHLQVLLLTLRDCMTALAALTIPVFISLALCLSGDIPPPSARF